MLSNLLFSSTYWSKEPINFFKVSKMKGKPILQKPIIDFEESLEEQFQTEDNKKLEELNEELITNQLKEIKSWEDFYRTVELYSGKIIEDGSLNTVIMDGDVNSKIMIIGEAPGEEEDIQKKPFVGRSGILLNKMLDYANLKRENVYITNIAYWRPKNNRTPNKKEINLLRPFILKQIEMQKPEIILLLGRIAVNSIFNSMETMEKLREKVHSIKMNYGEVKIIVSFHPSFLLRFPIKKKDAKEDLDKLKDLIELK